MKIVFLLSMLLYTARKIRFTQIFSGQIWCKKSEKEQEIEGKDGKYSTDLHTSLHGVIISLANAVCTIFALDLTLVCTFLHHICTK